MLGESAHLAHIFGSDSVDDGSGTHEQQGLEEGVVHHVEASSGESGGTGGDECCALGISHLHSERDEVSSCSESEDHVTELGDGGVSQDLLDVHVVECHGGRDECGDSSDDSDEQHDVGALDEQGVSPCDEVDSRLDHCCRVDK